VTARDEPPVGADDGFRPPDVLPLAEEATLRKVRPVVWPRYVIGTGVVAYGLLIVVALGSGAFELIDAIPLIPLLAYLTLRIGRRLARADADPAVLQLVLAAFWAKMLGTILRAGVVSWFYDNRSDANDFHLWGKSFAPQFRHLDFSAVPSWSGTDFMRAFTGIVYSFTGASKVSGAIVMSFLSFLGLLLLWRAFKIAVPKGDAYRYSLLVLFLPSLLYWPSALGKEGFAILCLGLVSYGVARVMTGRIPIGVLLVALGLGGATLLRPHVALTAFCGISLAGLVGKSRRPSGKSSVMRIVLFAVLLVVGSTLAASTASFFGVPSLTQETVNETLNNAEGRTSEAGSSFSPVSMSNPANAPLAIVTVLFRPFPIEASNVVSAASAFEGVFLMVLLWKSRRRVRSVFRSMRRDPYIAYCMGVVLTFIYAFSAFSNFGILARQRCQVLPFFLVVVCLPEWHREGVISEDEALAGRDETPRDPFADEPAIDPYRRSATAGSPDPYAGVGLEWDPYREFADMRTRQRDH
jgi:hypothetical protein